MAAPWEKAERAVGIEDLVQRLTDAPGASLNSVLLEVMRRRSQNRGAKAVMGQHRTSPFVAPCDVDPADLDKVAGLVRGALPDSFDEVALAPVVPLGTVSAVARADQNKICAAARSMELVADPTNALALVAAERRKADASSVVRLGARHRALRMQRFDFPGATQHFELWGFVTAGRDPGGRTFEAKALTEHIALNLAILAALREAGMNLGPTRLRVLVDPAHASWLDPLCATLPRHTREELEPGYYQLARIQVDAEYDGAWLNLADGGFVDWMATLTTSKRERLFISGIGTERLARLWASS